MKSLYRTRENGDQIVHKSDDLVFNTASAPVNHDPPFDATYSSKLSKLSFSCLWEELWRPVWKRHWSV